MTTTRQVNRHGERGSVSVQMVLLLPTLLVMLWIALGAAMYYYGRTTALAAAQAAAAAGAIEHGTETDCVQAGTDLARRAGDSLADITVTCRRTPTAVTATVTGTTLSLVPGWEPATTQTATVPTERITR